MRVLAPPRHREHPHVHLPNAGLGSVQTAAPESRGLSQWGLPQTQRRPGPVSPSPPVSGSGGAPRAARDSSHHPVGCLCPPRWAEWPPKVSAPSHWALGTPTHGKRNLTDVTKVIGGRTGRLARVSCWVPSHCRSPEKPVDASRQKREGGGGGRSETWALEKRLACCWLCRGRRPEARGAGGLWNPGMTLDNSQEGPGASAPQRHRWGSAAPR